MFLYTFYPSRDPSTGWPGVPYHRMRRGGTAGGLHIKKALHITEPLHGFRIYSCFICNPVLFRALYAMWRRGERTLSCNSTPMCRTRCTSTGSFSFSNKLRFTSTRVQVANAVICIWPRVCTRQDTFRFTTPTPKVVERIVLAY